MRIFWRFPNSWGLVRFKSQGSSWGKRGNGPGPSVGNLVHVFLIHWGLCGPAFSLSPAPLGPRKKALFSRSRKSCLLAVNKLISRSRRACLGRGVGGQAPSPTDLLGGAPLAAPIAALDLHVPPRAGKTLPAPIHPGVWGRPGPSCAHLEQLPGCSQQFRGLCSPGWCDAGGGRRQEKVGASVVSGGCWRPGLPRCPGGPSLPSCAHQEAYEQEVWRPEVQLGWSPRSRRCLFHGKLLGMFLCNACPELLADPCFPFPPLLLPPPLHGAPRTGRPWGPGEARVFPATTSGGQPSPCAPRHLESRRPATLLGPPPGPSPQNPEPGLQGQARSKHPAGVFAGE